VIGLSVHADPPNCDVQLFGGPLSGLGSARMYQPRLRLVRLALLGVVVTRKFETRIKELVESIPDLAELVEPLLVVRRRLGVRMSAWTCRQSEGKAAE
jgi:hypothetical protein